MFGRTCCVADWKRCPLTSYSSVLKRQVIQRLVVKGLTHLLRGKLEALAANVVQHAQRGAQLTVGHLERHTIQAEDHLEQLQAAGAEGSRAGVQQGSGFVQIGQAAPARQKTNSRLKVFSLAHWVAISECCTLLV